MKKSISTTIFILILVTVIVFAALYIPAVNKNIKEAYLSEVGERQALALELLNENETDFTVGARDPKVRIITYTDTDCTFCAKMEPRFDRLMAEYPEEVAITYRHFDLPLYPNSTYEMLALECVGMMAGSEAYRDFQNNFLLPNQFSAVDDYTTQVTVFATSYLIGSDADKVASCIKDPATQERLDNKRASGATLGARQTPTLIYVDKEGNYKLQSGSLPYEKFLPALNDFLGEGNALGS